MPRGYLFNAEALDIERLEGLPLLGRQRCEGVNDLVDHPPPAGLGRTPTVDHHGERVFVYGPLSMFRAAQ